ncbi:MAG: hydroxymethylbilane synthase [Caulobacteraceae bacterium]|nr:hydroxymethylbilane synthase [Caulobacteraceae bacterium]
MAGPEIRIGTRGSKLALVQAGQVRDRITALLAPVGGSATLVPISTRGDRIQDRVLTDIGGKGLFTLEIEAALNDGRIDCAVHSLKDMPAADPPGLVIAAIPPRENPRDALVSVRFAGVDALPAGARLGTASLRRAAQMLHRRPDLAVTPMRGNVDSRLAKLEAGEADAILLAMAGLNRLGLAARAAALLDPHEHPPAPGQGALAIQARVRDAGAPWLAGLDDAASAVAVAAERGALTALEGSCRTAIGAYATADAAGGARLVVEALTPDGARRFRRQGESAGGAAAARGLGLRLGEAIRAEAGDALFA